MWTDSRYEAINILKKNFNRYLFFFIQKYFLYFQLLDIVHPAAKTLVDIAKSQDAEVSAFFTFYTIREGS